MQPAEEADASGSAGKRLRLDSAADAAAPAAAAGADGAAANGAGGVLPNGAAAAGTGRVAEQHGAADGVRAPRTSQHLGALARLHRVQARDRRLHCDCLASLGVLHAACGKADTGPEGGPCICGCPRQSRPCAGPLSVSPELTSRGRYAGWRQRRGSGSRGSARGRPTRGGCGPRGGRGRASGSRRGGVQGACGCRRRAAVRVGGGGRGRGRRRGRQRRCCGGCGRGGGGGRGC